MATDQQFCLRWNNHQSTLISVFDSLLENGTLVDCTLAAEGQYLKAHKVVLSACSPYLETLLSQHYEKHPIVILKDVKFSELKSMMDYMYRGEVNISQDQLGTFLKAAESLQIKGLSDNGDDARDVGSTAKKPDAPRPSVTQTRAPVESKRPAPVGDLSDTSRDGSISPSSLRKRRRTRRPSQGDDPDSNLDNNICDLPAAQSTPMPVPSAAPVQSLPKQIVKTEPPPPMPEPVKKEILDPPAEPLLEPKTEYLDYMNNENSIEVEDLTLDDDDEEGLDSSMDASRPGPSHGDLSQQGGYPPWTMTGDQSGTDEIFMAAQEAVGAATGQQQRDSQDENHPILHQGRPVALKKVKQRVGAFCNDCGSGCRNNGTLGHKDSCPKMQTNEVFQCQCGDIFSTRKSLTVHRIACRAPMQVKQRTAIFKCNKCGRSFKSKKTYSLHVDTCFSLPGTNLKVVCKCGKECKSFQGLSYHKRFCSRPISPDEVKELSKPLGNDLKSKNGKRSAFGGIKEEKLSKKSGFTELLPIVEEKENDINFDGVEKKHTTESVVNHEGDNLTNTLDIVKEIAEDFYSEPTTPLNVDEQIAPLDLHDKDHGKDDADDDGYCRHLPLSPVSFLHDTPIKTDARQKNTSETFFQNISSSSSTGGTQRKKVKREVVNSPVMGDGFKNISRRCKYSDVSNRKLRCECGAVFKTKMAHRKHKMMLCKAKMMRCIWCPFLTKLNTTMRNHVLESHRDVLVNVFTNSSSE